MKKTCVKLLSGLLTIGRRVDCVLGMAALLRGDGAVTSEHLPAPAWNIDYRTAGGFRCPYVDASTAWDSLDRILLLSERGDENPPSSAFGEYGDEPFQKT